MKIILPYNFNVPNTTDCWNSKFLGIILSNPQNYSWYLNKFIDIYLIECATGFYTSYYNWGSNAFNNVYTDILDFIPVKLNPDKLVDETQNILSNNSYVYVEIDYYYVPGCEAYNNYHYVHDCLILGLDTQENVIYFTDFNIDNKLFDLCKIDIKPFITAYSSAKDINKNAYTSSIIGLPACIINLQNKTNTVCDISKFFYESLLFSMGEVRSIERYQLKKYNCYVNLEEWEKTYKEWHGLSVYHAYSKMIDIILKTEYMPNDEEIFSIIRFIQNRISYYEKINYLYSLNILKNNLEKRKMTDKLFSSLSSFKNNTIKYLYSKEKRSIKKAQNSLKVAQKTDSFLLDLYIDEMYYLLL